MKLTRKQFFQAIAGTVAVALGVKKAQASVKYHPLILKYRPDAIDRWVRYGRKRRIFVPYADADDERYSVNLLKLARSRNSTHHPPTDHAGTPTNALDPTQIARNRYSTNDCQPR